MGLIDSLLRPVATERTKSLDELAAWYGLDVATSSGAAVTEGNALKLSTVYACVRLLSESVASLPLHTYRRLERGKERADLGPLTELLHDQPNPSMSSFVFRETLQGHLLLWGNAYAWIERASRGQIVALWPVRPDKVKAVPQKDGTVVYEYDFRGEKLKSAASSMLHFPGLGFDGITGYSPIGLMRQAIGLGLAAEDYGARFFGNSASPSGVLTTPNKLSEEAEARLKKGWEEAHSGSRIWSVAVLHDGLTWQALGVKPEEAQFLETRNFQAQEIARAYGVPPWMVGVPVTGSMTYSNVEQQQIAFVTYSLRPWLVRWEQEINRKLFTDSSTFAEFTVDALLRGDTLSRYRAYEIGRKTGWLSANEVRERENMNPVDGGDEYGAAASPAAPGPAGPDESDEDEGEDEADVA